MHCSGSGPHPMPSGMGYAQQPYPMFQQMPMGPGQNPADNAAQLQQEQFDSVKSKLQIISTSVSVLFKMPKNQQIDAITRVCSELDSTLTGKLDMAMLSVVVWLISDLTPNCTLSGLRITYYEDLHSKYAKSVARKKDCYWSSMEVHLFK